MTKSEFAVIGRPLPVELAALRMGRQEART